MSWIKEFKDFASRGNLVGRDRAVRTSSPVAWISPKKRSFYVPPNRC